jgi:hypothetical protein
MERTVCVDIECHGRIEVREVRELVRESWSGGHGVWVARGDVQI